ncbi:hypothetical protein MAR_021246 [Mya arenaria]|uniref:Ig-like domain-containing protein n=1 Tax=Mya arenaria TaxID=6604 RepID=A0ABY7EAQ2_MYAAR|nr:hypothetical protein MAR_021246 [Mya arenaria]
MKMRQTVLLHSVIIMICLDWINTAVLRLQWRKTIYENYTDLAMLQCVDKNNKVSYEKPFLVKGESGWRATGVFDSNHFPPVGTQLGIVRQVSTVSTEESGEYRCHLAYTEGPPAYSSAKASVSKTLTLTGSSPSSSSVTFLPHVFGHVLCNLCCILLFKWCSSPY